VGWDSTVGIAAHYRLDGLGIPLGMRFSASVQTGPRAHPASCTMGTGSFPGVKRPGRGIDHPPPSSAKVKERVELYLYSPLWAFVACSGVNFTFQYTTVCFSPICRHVNHTSVTDTVRNY